ncbi:hypothetical protein [Methanopyrus sp.]
MNRARSSTTVGSCSRGAPVPAFPERDLIRFLGRMQYVGGVGGDIRDRVHAIDPRVVEGLYELPGDGEAVPDRGGRGDRPEGRDSLRPGQGQPGHRDGVRSPEVVVDVVREYYALCDLETPEDGVECLVHAWVNALMNNYSQWCSEGGIPSRRSLTGR